MPLFEFICGNLIICRISEEYIEGITKSDILFAPTFVNHYLLAGVNFSGHFLININIYIL